MEMQRVRLGRGIEMLIRALPRWLNANAQQQNRVAAHTVAPVGNRAPSMASHVGLFH
jgi:hypothetical protein